MVVILDQNIQLEETPDSFAVGPLLASLVGAPSAQALSPKQSLAYLARCNSGPGKGEPPPPPSVAPVAEAEGEWPNRQVKRTQKIL